MELLEYQAKELFRQMGIPVLPSQRIHQPRDLRSLTIPYPIVLKSQVHTGRRGKAGGIRFVENTIDAMAVAQTIFHLPIMGNYPEILLAEAKYNADREFYLAVVLDSSSRRPVLLGSQYGGEDVESHLDQMQQVTVEREFSPFYARRLALKMGLRGSLIQAVSAVVEKMYALFIRYDLDLIEINPLGISATGELMALDGKLTINDAALERHTDLEQLFPTLSSYSDPQSPSAGLNLVELEGNIGVLCNGAGLAMTTLDLICRAKGKPAGFVDLGGEYRQGWSLMPLQERIQHGLDLLQQAAELKVILINIIGSTISCLDIANTIAGCWQPVASTDKSVSTPQLVVRLVGDDFALAQEQLDSLHIPVFNRLDDAIAHAIHLTKPSKP
jgi:succinyl-CoA synthetase beta subunit